MNDIKILFSMPVHENNDLIRNQIENIKKFIRNPKIVIHVNKFWDGFDYDIIKQYSDVYVNSNRVYGRSKIDSHLSMIISNFEYGKTVCDFDYFCCFHTTEMFIKPGLEEYIGNNMISHQHFPQINNPNILNVLSRTKLADYIPKYNLFNNHVEGNFYHKDIFSAVIGNIRVELPDLDDNQGFSIEETLIPTIAYDICDKNKIVPTYLRFVHHTQMTFDIDIVKKFLVEDIMLDDPILCGYGIPTNTDTIFSLKTISWDNPARAFINSL